MALELKIERKKSRITKFNEYSPNNICNFKTRERGMIILQKYKSVNLRGIRGIYESHESKEFSYAYQNADLWI